MCVDRESSEWTGGLQLEKDECDEQLASRSSTRPGQGSPTSLDSLSPVHTVNASWPTKSLRRSGLPSTRRHRCARVAFLPDPLPPPPGPDSLVPPSQATATRATKLELDRSYDAAFTAYLAAAQTYLFLVRHTTDAASKAKFRALSAKLVERAERIKLARKQDIKPVQRDPLSIGAPAPSFLAAPHLVRQADLHGPSRGAGLRASERGDRLRAEVETLDWRGPRWVGSVSSNNLSLAPLSADCSPAAARPLLFRHSRPRSSQPSAAGCVTGRLCRERACSAVP